MSGALEVLRAASADEASTALDLAGRELAGRELAGNAHHESPAGEADRDLDELDIHGLHGRYAELVRRWLAH
ncbi:MAG: hypothetical protein JNJ54_33810 [Myxococcaceae bacterium]|nr:hypothetical protein [Myxococcaceae bacterium]